VRHGLVDKRAQFRLQQRWGEVLGKDGQLKGFLLGEVVAPTLGVGIDRLASPVDLVSDDVFHLGIREFAAPAWAEKFHVWQMDWDEDFIRLYVDEELLNEVPLDATINDDRERANPFREPHYLILTLAIGGTQGGDPADTAFPARFEVDYVRVYQEIKPAATVEYRPFGNRVSILQRAAMYHMSNCSSQE